MKGWSFNILLAGLVLGALTCIVVPTAHADLLVGSDFTDSILRYDETTGAFLGVFASGGGLDGPIGLVLGPDGNLYVTSGDGSVLRYSGTTGAFIDAFVPSGSGGLDAPQDLVFGPDGNLYVTSGNSGNVLRYNGTTGGSSTRSSLRGAVAYSRHLA
jgi:outer membrane protein assembly factor BamB